MRKFREAFLHVATVIGYMWAGWLCAMNEKWYWIILVIGWTSIVHSARIVASIKNDKEDK